ncbi:MAG: sodium:proton antiporter NhaD [Simkania sp.]|nr:sodium:proton antiporter NhaD [Simkania sp.]
MTEAFSLTDILILIVFTLGYFAIIAEHYLQVNKTGVALFMAVVCWSIYFCSHIHPVSEELVQLGHHVSDIAQIVFFLVGAMTIVELIDVHKGFKLVTDVVRTSSKRKMLLMIAVVTFFLSAVLDNLTTTILMVSLLRKLIPEKKDRFLLCCIVVIAANAGGAWTPIGDVTTTMLWINGQISSLSVMQALFLPSVVSLAVPVVFYLWRYKGKYVFSKDAQVLEKTEPKSKLILGLGVLSFVAVPIFKAVTGLPPFMGILIALGFLWLVTDVVHRGWEDRAHLRVPHVLTKIDASGILFFLGILLCVSALEAAGLLKYFAHWLDSTVGSQALVATIIGIISAIIDNVPLVAATMGMYPLSQFPVDHTLWHMIAYAAGTGGSMLIIGSSAGVAMMGMEKVDFLSYLKKASLPVFIGYLAGMGTYLLLG